jgi:Lrp/AsnC family transcriptional regulator, regulator for asnA, asnC and gidA
LKDIELDSLDRQVIEALGRDARISNRQIASDLGVAEATIRTRIRRLQGAHLIHFTALTDFRIVGSPTLVLFGIDADPRQIPKLAAELSAMPEINCVMVLLGRYDLLATGLFRSMTEVEELSGQSIRPLKGVRRIQTMVSMEQFKYDYRMARIVTRSATMTKAKTPSRRRRAAATASA